MVPLVDFINDHTEMEYLTSQQQNHSTHCHDIAKIRRHQFTTGRLIKTRS